MDNLIAQIVRDLYGFDNDSKLTRPDPIHGDFSTNVALRIAKQLGRRPQDVAADICAGLLSNDNIKAAVVAGPGFINLTVSDASLTQVLERMMADPKSYSRSTRYKDQVVVSEYSDPNPFKVLHVGHLYTSIIGDAISNLIEYSGGHVHRVNFGGDVGLHVGKTMWAILQEFGGEDPTRLAAIPESTRSEWMAKCYVLGTRSYEDDEMAKSAIVALNKRIYQIHTGDDHDSPLAQIYWQCRQWSYAYFDAFYARIGTKFEKYYPESAVAAIGLSTVLEQRDKGVYKDSQGAVIFEGEPYGLHTRVFVNKEGLPTYEAKDVGLSITKWGDYHFDESVIITGNDQLEYMKVVIKSIEQFKPELALRTKHYTHGNVKLSGGVKMASRKGNFLRAVDVLDMTADENEAAQGNRNSEPVLAAIKYAFLKNRIGADIIFEPKESVSLHGNSGPYLQYALSRANSIIEKLPDEPPKLDDYDIQYDSFERSLLVKLTEYKEVIELATSELAPHHVCTYLYDLAQTFNRFYENSHVLGDDRELIRSRLVTAYQVVLKEGLTILGIPTPNRM